MSGAPPSTALRFIAVGPFEPRRSKVFPGGLEAEDFRELHTTCSGSRHLIFVRVLDRACSVRGAGMKTKSKLQSERGVLRDLGSASRLGSSFGRLYNPSSERAAQQFGPVLDGIGLPIRHVHSPPG